MKKGIRTAVYDTALQLEVFRFQGIAQPFPSHFHAYYVIGLIEKGRRSLSCRSTVYSLRPGNIVLFNPRDTHACVQSDKGAMDYRWLNIPRETMLTLVEEITGKRALPAFSPAVIADKEAARCLRRLHEAVMGKACTLHREKLLLLLISLLLPYCSCPFEAHTPECRAEIEAACRFMEQHFAEYICLNDICRCAVVSNLHCCGPLLSTRA